MKNKIICLVLSLAVVFGLLGANGTYAWFVTISGAGNNASSRHNLVSGNIGMVLEGDFNTTDLILPEESNLLSEGGISISNTSLVDTEVRIKVAYTYFDENGTLCDVDYAGENTEFVVEAASGWTFNSDGYFYYETPLLAVTDSASEPIQIFSALYYSGENSEFSADNYDSTTDFKVTLTFQAKQAKYAEWSDIGTFESVPKESA